MESTNLAVVHISKRSDLSRSERDVFVVEKDLQFLSSHFVRLGPIRIVFLKQCISIQTTIEKNETKQLVISNEYSPICQSLINNNRPWRNFYEGPLLRNFFLYLIGTLCIITIFFLKFDNK